MGRSRKPLRRFASPWVQIPPLPPKVEVNGRSSDLSGPGFFVSIPVDAVPCSEYCEPVTSTDGALAAWGAYDRDNPFPLFAAVRGRGPVHAVTLADGHAAHLVVSYDEARAALND